jgi:hypothetical protein
MSGPAQGYNNLLESGLRHCNDASLVLRKMSELEGSTWSNFRQIEQGCIRQAATDTLSCAKRRWESLEWYENKLQRVIDLDGIASVRACLSPARDHDLWEASMAWLNMAVALEAIMWKTQRSQNRGEDTQSRSNSHDRTLNDVMDRFTKMGI